MFCYMLLEQSLTLADISECQIFKSPDICTVMALKILNRSSSTTHANMRLLFCALLSLHALPLQCSVFIVVRKGQIGCISETVSKFGIQKYNNAQLNFRNYVMLLRIFRMYCSFHTSRPPYIPLP